MGMLATHYTEEKERGNAFAFALGGLALGVLGKCRVQLERLKEKKGEWVKTTPLVTNIGLATFTNARFLLS